MTRFDPTLFYDLHFLALSPKMQLSFIRASHIISSTPLDAQARAGLRNLLRLSAANFEVLLLNLAYLHIAQIDPESDLLRAIEANLPAIESQRQTPEEIIRERRRIEKANQRAKSKQAPQIEASAPMSQTNPPMSQTIAPKAPELSQTESQTPPPNSIELNSNSISLYTENSNSNSIPPPPKDILTQTLVSLGYSQAEAKFKIAQFGRESCEDAVLCHNGGYWPRQGGRGTLEAYFSGKLTLNNKYLQAKAQGSLNLIATPPEARKAEEKLPERRPTAEQREKIAVINEEENRAAMRAALSSARKAIGH